MGRQEEGARVVVLVLAVAALLVAGGAWLAWRAYDDSQDRERGARDSFRQACQQLDGEVFILRDGRRVCLDPRPLMR